MRERRILTTCAACRLGWLILVGVVQALPVVPATAQLVYEAPTFGWQDNRDPDTPRPSPNAVVGQQIGSVRVMVAYGRPGVKGREVFGDSSDALVPYGTSWRTGANEATTVTLSGPVQIEGRNLEAGTYSLLTVPGPQTWTFIFNKAANRWGLRDYDPGSDVLRVKVPLRPVPTREWMTFSFEDLTPFSATLLLEWAGLRLALHIEAP